MARFKKDEMANLYKPDYVGEKKRDEMAEKIVMLQGDDIAYKLVFGSKKNMVECREKRYQNNESKMQRRLKYEEIKRHHDFFFNQKLKKYNSDYIDKMVNLLSKNDKNYLSKRKLLTIQKNDKTEEQKNKRPNPEVFTPKSLKKSKSKLKTLKIPHNFKKKKVQLSYDFDNGPNHSKDYEKGERIIEPTDEEYEKFAPELRYDKGLIFKRLQSENKFYGQTKNKIPKITNIGRDKIFKTLQMQNTQFEAFNSRNRLLFFDKLKRSESLSHLNKLSQDKVSSYTKESMPEIFCTVSHTKNYSIEKSMPKVFSQQMTSNNEETKIGLRSTTAKKKQRTLKIFPTSLHKNLRLYKL